MINKWHMTQEEKSLQRGAEWEQWGISPWQATEWYRRVEQAKTEMLNNWNWEGGTHTSERVERLSLRVLLCSSHNLTVADISPAPLLGLVSCQWGSISPAPASRVRASLHSASLLLTAWQGRILEIKPRKYPRIKYLLFHNLTVRNIYLSNNNK